MPYRNRVLLFLFLLLIWFIISTALNIHNIIEYNFKGTIGIVRFIKQYGSLFISAILILFTCLHVFNGQNVNQVFFSIRKVTLWSFIFVCIYGVLEILILVFGISFLMPILNLFNYFPFTEVYLPELKRISSVSFEPPELGTYLICIVGWMLSYIITEKNIWKYLPALFILILTYFSDSRSGIAIILFQFLLFGLLLLKQKRFRPILYRIFMISLIPITILFLFKGRTITYYIFEKLTSFSATDDIHGDSNRSRLGIQQANIIAFTERPITGAGFGQSAYVSKRHFPKWATDGNWEFSEKYLNPKHKPFPPIYNLYVRLLSESGIIGFFIFITFLCFTLIFSYKLYKNGLFAYKENDNIKAIGLVLLITFSGITINWIKADTFRIFGFWINLAFLIYLTGNKYKLVFNNKNSSKK
jgi:O-antigen ligase